MKPGILAGIALLGALACHRGGPSDAEAEAVVRRYCDKVVEAYRTSDVTVIEPLVSEPQAKKLTALIGVKRDAGRVLDARLLELAMAGVEQKGAEVRVLTRERWIYLDREIGSGAAAGAESTDSYHLCYHLAREGGRWLVTRIEFVEPPVVGTPPPELGIDARTMHGLPPEPDPPAEK